MIVRNPPELHLHILPVADSGLQGQMNVPICTVRYVIEQLP